MLSPCCAVLHAQTACVLLQLAATPANARQNCSWCLQQQTTTAANPASAAASAAHKQWAVQGRSCTCRPAMQKQNNDTKGAGRVCVSADVFGFVVALTNSNTEANTDTEAFQSYPCAPGSLLHTQQQWLFKTLVKQPSIPPNCLATSMLLCAVRPPCRCASGGLSLLSLPPIHPPIQSNVLTRRQGLLQLVCLL